jgi:hypothetical protein
LNEQYMSIAYVKRRVPATAVLVLTVSLGGCATSIAGSSLMDARAEAPAPPKTSGYLPVEDLPPSPEMMKADEQLKLKKELIAARDRQAAATKAPAKSTGAQRKPTQPTNQADRQ